MKLNSLIGNFLKVGLAYSSDGTLRFRAASGGAVTSILRYLLESRVVDCALAPRLYVKGGKVFGKYEIVRNPGKLIEYSGSIYAPTGVGKVLQEVTSRGWRAAFVGLPCRIKGLRVASQSSRALKECIKIYLGLYCYNVPRFNAFKYAVRTLLKREPREVSHVAFRGYGWPGYTTVILKTGEIFRIPSQTFFGSGFGQYFYGISCYLCSDHTAESADISFADPWTYQQNIGVGKTLIVIRTQTGLEVVRNAVETGYLVFEELPSPLYAIQYTTLLKKTVKVAVKNLKQQYALPPSISTVLYELDYLFGSRLARNEKLWPLLRFYVRTKPHLFRPLYALDYLLKPGFARVLAKVSRAWIKK